MSDFFSVLAKCDTEQNCKEISLTGKKTSINLIGLNITLGLSHLTKEILSQISLMSEYIHH